MATISNTPRPGYVWDSTDNVWYPIGVGGHSHSEIAKTIADAKGDLIVGTAADTVDRLAVGNNGESLVADSSTSSGLRWQSNFAAGKNAIINGAFNVWQRGTTLSSLSGTDYLADRFFTTWNAIPTTATISRQTFTPGTAPVSGYEGTYFIRHAVTTAGSSTTAYFQQKIEDVRAFAGQTVTISFWAKADSARTVLPTLEQNYGTGGSSATGQYGFASFSLTTSWVRYTATTTLASIAGKTIGTNSALTFWIQMPVASGSTIDVWGVQVEGSNTATAFQTATGTLQGELAACQRYYYRNLVGSTNFGFFAWGIGQGSSQALWSIPNPVTMRTTPTVVEFSNLGFAQTGAITAITTLVHSNSSPSSSFLQSDGSNTANTIYRLIGNSSASAYVGIGAEL